MSHKTIQDEVDKIIAKNSILKELNQIDSRLRELSAKAGENAQRGDDPTSQENEEIAYLVKRWKEQANEYLKNIL